MDTLFDNFVALENTIAKGISTLMKDVELEYNKLWFDYMQRTQEQWHANFSAKCPRTIERFRGECNTDTQYYMKKCAPDFHETKGVTSVSELKKLFKILVENDGATKQEALYLISGDEDDDAEEIKKHIEARHRFTDQFVAYEKNTAILAALETDEDGDKAVFVKISSEEE